MLDFLGLYVQAQEEGIVNRLKYITESKGFEDYTADGWETYITRLLGRCVRHHITEDSAVKKRRRELIYLVEGRGTRYGQIPEWKKVLTCSGYPYHPPRDIWTAADRNAVTYWSTRKASPDDEETMFTQEEVERVTNWYLVYENAVSLLECITVSPWYGVEVRYGTPMNRRYYRRSYGRYKASEAYQDFKHWKRMSDNLLESEENIAIIDQMMDFNVRADRTPVPPPEPEPERPEVTQLRDNMREIDEIARTPNLQDGFREGLRRRGLIT